MDLLEYDLEEYKKIHLNSKTFEIESDKSYQVKILASGIHGKKYSAYFAIIFLDRNGKEIVRRLRWINDFSGKIKEYEIVCKAVKDAKKAVLSIRINDEGVFPSKISLKISDLNSVELHSNNDIQEKYDEILHYPKWQINRINYLIENYNQYFELSNTLVNMGALFGDLSFLVSKKFPYIKCFNEEGRKENLIEGSKRYPDFEWKLINYENCELSSLSRADIVLNMGLFYHLSVKKAKEVFLASIERANKIVFFETEIIDCDNEDCFIETPGNTDRAQGLVNLEIKPSIPYINHILENAGYDYDFIESAKLNGHGHSYDWSIKNTKKWTSMKRKMWVIKKS